MLQNVYSEDWDKSGREFFVLLLANFKFEIISE